MRKHTLCITVLLLCACCSACDGGTAIESVSAETTETIVETELTDGLDGYDYDGATFNIVYSADQLGSAWPYTAEEEKGDKLNDSVFRRDVTVEERFNIQLSYNDVGGTGSEVPTAFMNSINAGSNEYQLGISHTFNNVPTMFIGNYLANFNEIPNIDLSKPWWNASIRDNLSIYGILPIGVSDLVYSYADVIYVNQDMIKNYELENTYDLVFDGKWTWTKLAEMAQTVVTDLDGDGAYTISDRFGYTTPGETASLMSRIVQSNGMLMATVKGDNIQLITVSERLQNAFERYYDLIYTENKTYMGSVTGKETSVEAFALGDILFMHQTTLQLPVLRDTEVNFGIVPLPKYDEAQENYQSMLSSQILLIPNLAEDELTYCGTITEALSYESSHIIVPALYESIFFGKYLRDATSYEMYQMIRSSLVCDFNWNYGGGNDITYMAVKLIKDNKSTNVASHLASCSPQIDASYAKLLEGVKKAYEVE